ncbi:MAG: hypothetical protein WD990_14150 [Acidimicrobiia bacterium]
MQITVPRRFQGIDGIAQGGHVAGLVAGHLDIPVAITFRNPCPLDRPLDLIDGTLLDDATVILEAGPAGDIADAPDFVPWDDAVRAREWAERQPSIPRVSHCFSCGSAPDSLQVHAGRVDGTSIYATPLVHPPWTAAEGTIEHRFLWAPIDCAAGWRVSLDDQSRPAVTGRLQVAVHANVEAGTRLVVVADADPEWTGRKRNARSAIYRDDGQLVASAESLWIALQ